MCGIGGIAFTDTQRPVQAGALRAMTTIMTHRGPDGEGYFHEPGVGLGMRRLSIIDTVSGSQPLSSEDGQIQVICNGEIYNHEELRRWLAGRGHRLATHSDAEVIAHAYEEEPHDFWHRLRGMFAIALWDGGRRRLLLVRDRLGIKPLYYAVTPEALIFGSEQKTVLASGLLRPELDRDSLGELFELGYLPGQETLLRGVAQLPAGGWLSFQEGHVQTGIYWDVSFPNASDYPSRNGRTWAAELRQVLQESVSLHLGSDVPVGAWLSAGIDSSAIAAMACSQTAEPMDTFSLGFSDPGADELRGSRLLDEYPEYQLRGHRRQCLNQHLELLPKAVWHREQPSSLGVGIARLLVSELAASKVKVVLSGEGADEVLGGYPWYRTQKLVGFFSQWPRVLQKALGRLLVWQGKWSGPGRVLLAPPTMGRERFQALVWTPSSLDLRGLFGSEPGRARQPFRVPAAFADWHPWNQLQYLDLKVRLAEMVLPSLDRFSMAHSLEARVPFLDHKVVEFCSLIPPRVKMPDLREKMVLRDAMKGLLPESVRGRKKFAMRGPIADWMGSVVPDFAAELLSERCLRDRGLFDHRYVTSVIDAHRSGRANHSRLLLLILGSQLWADQFLRAERFAVSDIGQAG
jgi:asparagine synthase (glutamine-hydrolysing)